MCWPISPKSVPLHTALVAPAIIIMRVAGNYVVSESLLCHSFSAPIIGRPIIGYCLYYIYIYTYTLQAVNVITDNLNSRFWTYLAHVFILKCHCIWNQILQPTFYMIIILKFSLYLLSQLLHKVKRKAPEHAVSMNIQRRLSTIAGVEVTLLIYSHTHVHPVFFISNKAS